MRDALVVGEVSAPRVFGRPGNAGYLLALAGFNGLTIDNDKLGLL